MYAFLCIVLMFGLIYGTPLETRSESYGTVSYNPETQGYEVQLGSGYPEQQYSVYPTQPGPGYQVQPGLGYPVDQGSSYPDPYQNNYNGQNNGQNPSRQQQYSITKRPPQQKFPESQNTGSQNTSKKNQGEGQNKGKIPNNNPDYLTLNTSGYDTVNIGNGSGKKNTVIINEGYGNQGDEILVATRNKQNPYNPNLQNSPYAPNNKNKGGQQPCYKNNVQVDPQYCLRQSVTGFNDYGESDYPSRTLSIGNGNNNENVVTLNGGRRRSPSYNTPTNQRKHVVNIYSQDAEISDRNRNVQISVGKGQNNKSWFSRIFGF